MTDLKSTELDNLLITDDPIRLALGSTDAARALGISQRLLWSSTNCGDIPHLRIGRRVVYPIDSLREWLTSESAKNMQRWRRFDR